MKNHLLTAATLGVLLSASCFAAPAGAPAGSTGLCKDGSYYSGADKKGACRGHKGVKDWFGDSSATPVAKVDKKAETKAEKKAEKAADKKADKAADKKADVAAPAASVVARPVDATGLCKDGSYYSSAEKKGACRGHKGIKDWYGAASAPVAAPATPTAKPAALAPAAAPMAAPAKPAAAAPASAPVAAPAAPAAKAPTAPAAGGGADKVWANMDSKVYHCSTSRWYGKTKKGEYMTEAQATAQGLRADHGKACH